MIPCHCGRGLFVSQEIIPTCSVVTKVLKKDKMWYVAYKNMEMWYTTIC